MNVSHFTDSAARDCGQDIGDGGQHATTETAARNAAEVERFASRVKAPSSAGSAHKADKQSSHGADGVWLYAQRRSIRSMGAKPEVWTRHLFVRGVSRCGAVSIGRLQRGYAEPGQGEHRDCKRCRELSQ